MVELGLKKEYDHCSFPLELDKSLVDHHNSTSCWREIDLESVNALEVGTLRPKVRGEDCQAVTSHKQAESRIGFCSYLANLNKAQTEDVKKAEKILKIFKVHCDSATFRIPSTV